MRRLLFAFLLLLARDTFAQTISAEIESEPIPFTNVASFLPAPAIAIAKDRTGVAIAWLTTGPGLSDRISVVRLDATGHFTGQVQAIPTVQTSSADPVYVVAPSIAAAPHGDGFTLAWVEILSITPSIARAAYCQLDRNLKPSTPAVVLAIAQPLAAPAIVRSGKTTWITASTSAFELRGDGTLSEPLNAGMNATDMTVAGDFPQIVGRDQLTSSTFTCDKKPGCAPVAGGPFRGFCTDDCRRFQYTYRLRFTSLYTVSAGNTIAFDTDGAPAIAADGRDVALVWFQGEGATGGSVVMSRLLPPSFADFATSVNHPSAIGTFGRDAGATRPAIASDGERYVVVWRTGTRNDSHDIAGASIDHAGNVIPLSIAATSADERDPSIIAIGNGTFLVAYEKISNGDRRLAGRIVTFDSRSHAVR